MVAWHVARRHRLLSNTEATFKNILCVSKPGEKFVFAVWFSYSFVKVSRQAIVSVKCSVCCVSQVITALYI